MANQLIVDPSEVHTITVDPSEVEAIASPRGSKSTSMKNYDPNQGVNPNKGTWVDDYIIEPGMQGIKKILNADFSASGVDNKAKAVSDVVRGVGGIASPYMVAGTLMNPFGAARAVVRGAVTGAVAKGAANVIGAGPGVSDLSADVGALYGAGKSAKNTMKAQAAPSPYNAMNPGPIVPTLPEAAEMVPYVGKIAKAYNVGAKATNAANEPRVVQVPGNPAPIPYDHPLAKLKAEARSSGMPAPPAQPINGFGRLEQSPQERSSGMPAPPVQSVNSLGRLQETQEGRSSGMPAPPINPTRSFRQRMAESAKANEEAASEAASDPQNVVARIKALSEPEPPPTQEVPPALQKFSEKFKATDPVEEAIKNPYAAKARGPKTAALIDLLKQMGFNKRDWELMSEGQRQSVANKAGFSFDGKLSNQTIATIHAGLE